MVEGAAIRPPLPVLRTVVEGYWWAIWHLRTYGVLALIWAVAAAVLQMLLGGLPRLVADASPLRNAALYAPGLAAFAVTMLGAAVIAVAAYRLVILDEPTDPWSALRLRRRELRFFGLSLLLYAVAVAEMLVLTVMLHMIGVLYQGGDGVLDGGGLPGLIAAALLWSLLVAVTLTPFVGFAFPLAAIDTPSQLLQLSFQLGRGYRLRLACIAFVADLLWILASHVPWALWGSSQNDMPEGLHTGLSTFIALLSTAFGAMVFGKAFAAVSRRQHEGVYDVFD
jgi:hypothetical protein